MNFSVWKGNKIRDFIKKKGLIEEIETRLGKKGRVAKFFIPTVKALDLLEKKLQEEGEEQFTVTFKNWLRRRRS